VNRRLDFHVLCLFYELVRRRDKWSNLKFPLYRYGDVIGYINLDIIMAVGAGIAQSV
jgi:hypothetical protein